MYRISYLVWEECWLLTFQGFASQPVSGCRHRLPSPPCVSTVYEYGPTRRAVWLCTCSSVGVRRGRHWCFWRSFASSGFPFSAVGRLSLPLCSSNAEKLCPDILIRRLARLDHLGKSNLLSIAAQGKVRPNLLKHRHPPGRSSMYIL